jgi:hypothetical protein
MAFVALTPRAKEQSTYVVEATFKDEYGGDVTPRSITWTLADPDGAVINGRQSVSITPATTVSIVLTGPDLDLGATEHIAGKRFLIIEARYNSTYGTNLYMSDHVSFYIDDVKQI